MSTAWQRAAAQYEKMSPREQRLALIVGGLAFLFIVVLAVRTAIDSLGNLDAQINRAQTMILNTENQIRHRESIEEQYARVAAQHSSAWTAAEIHDRLRAEIYRLAQRQPPALNADGVPEKMTNTTGELVSIPSLQQGNLTEGEQGYREYMLNFNVPPAPLKDMIDFIDRLQNSPQSLRVDVLELTRDPLGEDVSANITITRTIVAGVKEDKAAVVKVSAPKAAGEKKAAGMKLNAAEWKTENCEVGAETGGSETTALVFTPKAAGATAYVERAMPPGVYQVSLDLSADGPASITVADNGEPLKGAVEVSPNKNITCTFQCRTRSDGRPQLRIPLLKLAEAGSTVRLTRMAVEKVAE